LLVSNRSHVYNAPFAFGSLRATCAASRRGSLALPELRSIVASRLALIRTNATRGPAGYAKMHAMPFAEGWDLYALHRRADLHAALARLREAAAVHALPGDVFLVTRYAEAERALRAPRVHAAAGRVVTPAHRHHCRRARAGSGALRVRAVLAQLRKRTAHRCEHPARRGLTAVNTGMSTRARGGADGGYPVVENGLLLGAIGVSGADQARDAEVAKAAIAALGLAS
jgi:uncharacterized protein GlcG (DUF336 family)